MEQNLSDLLNNRLFVSMISLIAGVLITGIASWIRNKTSAFPFSLRTNRVGLSADDAIFGSVRITWQNQQMRNLYTATLELENATVKDFENIEFKVYAGNETFLLNESTAIVDTPYIINWTDEYSRSMEVPEGEQLSNQQWDQYYHSREYAVPVFNRTQKLQFTYLCTRPNDDQVPGVWVSTQARGIRLKQRANLNEVLGVPVPIAIVRGLIISIAVVVACGFFLKNVWITATLSMMVGSPR